MMSRVATSLVMFCVAYAAVADDATSTGTDASARENLYPHVAQAHTALSAPICTTWAGMHNSQAKQKLTKQRTLVPAKAAQPGKLNNARSLHDPQIIVSMPGGLKFPASCIHYLLENEIVISRGAEHGDEIRNVLTGSSTHLPPCSQTLLQARGGIARNASSPHAEASQLGYFSAWIVDAYAVQEGISKLVSNWTVPKAPKSRGPVPGMSSAYLFNGLEDGGGVHGASTGILQPVLSYGKSGCVLNPLAGWVFSSFHVTGAGRAYCGPRRVRVSEGDVLTGRMEKVSNDTWEIVADAGAKGVAKHSATFSGSDTQFTPNAAYITLEGMVIYGCEALPGGNVTFSGNIISTGEGGGGGGPLKKARWKAETRRSECSPSVTIGDAGKSVVLGWQL